MHEPHADASRWCAACSLQAAATGVHLLDCSQQLQALEQALEREVLDSVDVRWQVHMEDLTSSAPRTNREAVLNTGFRV